MTDYTNFLVDHADAARTNPVVLDCIEDVLIFGFDIDPGIASVMAIRIAQALRALDTESTSE